MKPHCERESQFELFEAAAPAAELAPKLALPFQRSAEIDIARICRILGVNKCTVRRMIEAKLFRAYKAPGEKLLRIEYDSVVDYCNRLRLEYRITPQTLGRVAGRRFRDEDLLPFPIAETTSVAEVCGILDCTREAVGHLIDEGLLVAYQIQIGTAGSPWRIHRRSLEHYVDSLHAQAVTSCSHRPTSRR